LLYKFDRIFVRSNVQPIEQRYYRTVVRYREAAMGMTSAAEAKLDARIRPEIAVLRSRTSYPRRARGQAARTPALAVLAGGAEAGHPAKPSDGAGADAPAGPVPAAAAVAGAVAVAPPVVRQAAARPARAGEALCGPAGRAAVDGQRFAAAPAGTTINGAPAAGRVRLTRRGKIVVGALLGLAVAGLAALIWLAVAGQAEAAGPAGLDTGSGAGHTMLRVVVRPGETLWSIAVRTDPGADPRAVIQEIVDDNAMRGTAIQTGQVLWVPRS
jgi:nucleoid-associated protein YgaU